MVGETEAAFGARADPVAHQQRGDRQCDRQQCQPHRTGFPAGHVGERIDRQRQRARLSGDVANEGHRRAEFAEAAREAQHAAGDEPWGGKRQRDRGEHPPRTRTERRGGVLQSRVDQAEGKADRLHHQWKRHDRRCQRRTFPGKRDDDAELRFEPAPQRSLRA